MIHIEFDDERNVPEDRVQAAAQEARRYDARLGRIHGLRGQDVAARATSAAGMIAGATRRFSRVAGRFSTTGIDAHPMKPDYRAALSVRGGIEPRHLPWLACERAIAGHYDVTCQRVGFQLDFFFKMPPATVTLNLSARCDDSLAPDEEDATLAVGVARVPFPMHLPAGMAPADLARAIELIMPVIERSALDLWIESEGGTREVF
jgi:hypothetical protein